MQDILHPGSENSMNVLLAQCDLLKKQNNSISDNMQICAHIQHILTPKDLPRNRSCPSTVHRSILNVFKTSKKSPQQSLFFTANALENEIFSCPGKFKFECVEKKY